MCLSEPLPNSCHGFKSQCLGTLSLASQAAAAGVSRFIFMSSVKALAERSGSRPLRPDDAPAPEDAYGRAKLAAELGLAQIQADTGLNIVTLRPPLIYGPRAKGNFALLVRVVRRGLPLPFASLTNRAQSAERVEPC
jgi:nucleoside-diphosphate-sugar epimerase